MVNPRRPWCVLPLYTGNPLRTHGVTTGEVTGQEASMGERVLRGSRLGTTSYETDRNTDLAPRQDIAFDCPHGHETRVPMSSEAELPATWECRVCGAPALRRDGEQP